MDGSSSAGSSASSSADSGVGGMGGRPRRPAPLLLRDWAAKRGRRVSRVLEPGRRAKALGRGVGAAGGACAAAAWGPL